MRFIVSRTLCAIASLTLLAGTAGRPVLAQTNIPVQTHQTGAWHHHRHHGGAWARLNLTAAQRAKIKQIRRQERADLKGVLTPRQINRMREIKESYRREIRAVLTPDQRAQFDRIWQRHKHHHRGM